MSRNTSLSPSLSPSLSDFKNELHILTYDYIYPINTNKMD